MKVYLVYEDRDWLGMDIIKICDSQETAEKWLDNYTTYPDKYWIDEEEVFVDPNN